MNNPIFSAEQAQVASLTYPASKTVASPKKIFVALAVCMTALVMGCGVGTETPSVRESIDLSTAMAGDTTGYDRARPGIDLAFPEDFGPHPTFKTEWWYFTGNLDSENGDRFGYELTIFRSAVAPHSSENESNETSITDSTWATNQLYMGHFSLANADGMPVGISSSRQPTFHAFERFSRGALGLAGAQANPFKIWLDDWTIESSGSDLFPLRIQATEDSISIDLTLSSLKPIVLQGDNGFDQKGSDQGNASYYYSFTRLETEGTISIQGEPVPVTGFSWKDHEWSTSALDENQEGWDWFSLQLDDGREVMFYVLRETGGTIARLSSGTMVDADGSYSHLMKDDVSLDVLETWKSPHSGATYPSGWTMTIPKHDLSLTITPIMNDQELNVSVRYWEGAVTVEGNDGIGGRGYVEMTGYK